ncbi:MAG: hypothetical protein ACOCV7_07235 [Desulfonatronovibrionaceae bacterium]
MEKILKKLADQLSTLDEASLINLWDKYYARVQSFTPSREWEEDVLILSLIQSVRWKNQLFNHCMHSQTLQEPQEPQEPQESEKKDTSNVRPPGRDRSKKAAKVLSFRPRE